MIAYSIFKTPLGWMGVVNAEKGLQRIILPYPDQTEVEEIIFQEFPEAKKNNFSCKPFTKALTQYCEGTRIAERFPLDWSGNTEFCVTVWKATRFIPWGEIRSYQWLSAQLKNPHAFRAVGNALGKNPFPIVVPCHRVVRSDGALGGFSGPEGILLKQKLLEWEGIAFDNKGRVADDTLLKSHYKK